MIATWGLALVSDVTAPPWAASERSPHVKPLRLWRFRPQRVGPFHRARALRAGPPLIIDLVARPDHQCGDLRRIAGRVQGVTAHEARRLTLCDAVSVQEPFGLVDPIRLGPVVGQHADHEYLPIVLGTSTSPRRTAASAPSSRSPPPPPAVPPSNPTSPARADSAIRRESSPCSSDCRTSPLAFPHPPPPATADRARSPAGATRDPPATPAGRESRASGRCRRRSRRTSRRRWRRCPSASAPAVHARVKTRSRSSARRPERTPPGKPAS